MPYVKSGEKFPFIGNNNELDVNRAETNIEELINDRTVESRIKPSTDFLKQREQHRHKSKFD